MEKSETEKEQRNLFKFMVKNFITETGVSHIRVQDYIDFFEQIPLRLFATRPIFYFRKGKFDGLGMLGERIHQYTLITKTLQLYYSECLGIRLIDVLDNTEPMFKDIENPKLRLLESLYYLKENTKEGDLRSPFITAKKILHGRYY